MKKRLKAIRKKSGTTLVEMIVSLLLVELLMVMVIGIISPAAKIFVRIQKLQFAQMILDNVAEEMKSQVQSAVGFVKVYDGDGLQAADSGTVLEFMNTDGYVVLMSTGGCEDTTIIRGAQEAGTSGAVKPGKLLMRYYWPEMKENGTYTYSYRKNGTPVARAVNPVFTDRYYMGNYLTVTFSLPAGTAQGAEVTSLTAKISLYENGQKQKLAASEEVVLNIRYQAERTMHEPPTAQMVSG